MIKLVLRLGFFLFYGSVVFSNSFFFGLKSTVSGPNAHWEKRLSNSTNVNIKVKFGQVFITRSDDDRILVDYWIQSMNDSVSLDSKNNIYTSSLIIDENENNITITPLISDSNIKQLTKNIKLFDKNLAYRQIDYVSFSPISFDLNNFSEGYPVIVNIKIPAYLLNSISLDGQRSLAYIYHLNKTNSQSLKFLKINGIKFVKMYNTNFDRFEIENFDEIYVSNNSGNFNFKGNFKKSKIRLYDHFGNGDLKASSVDIRESNGEYYLHFLKNSKELVKKIKLKENDSDFRFPYSAYN